MSGQTFVNSPISPAILAKPDYAGHGCAQAPISGLFNHLPASSTL